jgi:hypothetical protein
MSSQRAASTPTLSQNPIVVALSCAVFHTTETIVLTLITLLLGYLLGRLQKARWRRDRYTALARKLQLGVPVSESTVRNNLCAL